MAVYEFLCPTCGTAGTGSWYQFSRQREQIQVFNYCQSDKNFRRAIFTPLCNKCGMPMELEWSGSITGKKETWYCRKCLHYRIINPSFNKAKVYCKASDCPECQEKK